VNVVGRGLLVGQQVQRVGQRRPDHGVPVAARAGRAGEVDDQRRADRARRAAHEQAVGRLRDRVGADRLGDARRLAVEHGPGRLRRDVARGQTGTAGRQDKRRVARELHDRGGDPVGLVGNQPPLDFVTIGTK
jgi:hypothetical protein